MRVRQRLDAWTRGMRLTQYNAIGSHDPDLNSIQTIATAWTEPSDHLLARMLHPTDISLPWAVLQYIWWFADPANMMN
jgi:hypothetical protein